MARRHSTDDTWTNPEVRYERGDVNLSRVVAIGAAITLVIAVLSAATTWLGLALSRSQERKQARRALPRARADSEPLPAAPRLEAIEDLRQGKVELYPPRARAFLRSQKELLDEGDPAQGIEPIEKAIDRLANRLPVAGKKHPAPTNFAVPLPSKAASGRAQTGGQ